MRLIDADELMEHVWRDKLDSRELIATMVENAPTAKEIPTKTCKKLAELTVKKSADYYGKVVKAIKNAGFAVVISCDTSTERHYIIAESEV